MHHIQQLCNGHVPSAMNAHIGQVLLSHTAMLTSLMPAVRDADTLLHMQGLPLWLSMH